MHGLSLYLDHLRNSSDLCFVWKMLEKPESSQWYVDVHSGYVPGRTFLGTYCRDFYWLIRRHQPAWFNQVVFEDLARVWQLESCEDE